MLNGKGPSGPDRRASEVDARAGKKALVKTKTVTVKQAGAVNATLKLTKEARKRLVKKHKLKLKLQVDFTPTGGERTSKRKTLKVKRKH